MPLQATSGAASYDAFGGGVPVVPTFVEDVFSCFLYTGNGSTQTINNGIDLSGKGGLVWFKGRTGTINHSLYDTARGRQWSLATNNTTQQEGPSSSTEDLTSFNSNGFSLGTPYWSPANNNGVSSVSWTFRKQPKFFDVVTYTGDGTSNRAVAHNLGSVPGFMIVKVTSESNNWTCWHRSITGKILELNTTAAQANDSGGGYFYSSPDATNIYLGSDWQVNKTDATYVAYLFAHNAGGFGLTGTDNVISCGSFTPDALGNVTVTLGYEPQWILYKGVSGAGGTDSWVILDTMRGWDLTTSDRRLFPNSSGAENTSSAGFPTATGFQVENLSASPYIYIAIRRGPMKVPTSGTSVFEPATRTGTGANATVTTSISPVDMAWAFNRSGILGQSTIDFDRLRGALAALYTGSTASEDSAPNTLTGFDVQNGYRLGSDSGGYGINFSSATFVNYNFRRAPSFFDEVCYTGNGGYVSRNHNLAVVPEMMIVKARSTTSNWSVYHSALGFENYVRLNTTAASAGTGDFWYQTPTTTQFSTGGYADIDDTGVTYVAYLFATCAGVSKVFSYIGNGTSKTIDCGFTGGARFVLIKRTDSTGDWYVWDTARGIVSGNDPHLSLNSTAAEVTSDDTIDTDSTGFVVNQLSATNVNVSSATYIGLAIA
jgi:hypothetical protein